MKIASRRGISLVEVMVTLGLSILLLSGMFAMTASTTQSRSFSRERELAVEAARSRLEVIQDMAMNGQIGTVPTLNNTTFAVPNAADYPAGTSTSTLQALVSPTNGPAGLVLVDSDPQHPGTATPINVGTPSVRVYRVTVQVNWRSAAGGDFTVESVALVTNRTSGS